MTIELDSVAANAPDNAEGATVRTARYAINAAHASGNITGEQHAEALRKLLMNGHALTQVPPSKRTPARSRGMVGPRARWLWIFVPAHGRRHCNGIAVIRFISHLHRGRHPRARERGDQLDRRSVNDGATSAAQLR